VRRHIALSQAVRASSHKKYWVCADRRPKIFRAPSKAPASNLALAVFAVGAAKPQIRAFAAPGLIANFAPPWRQTYSLARILEFMNRTILSRRSSFETPTEMPLEYFRI
jgi:hypothetical protein